MADDDCTTADDDAGGDDDYEEVDGYGASIALDLAPDEPAEDGSNFPPTGLARISVGYIDLITLEWMPCREIVEARWEAGPDAPAHLDSCLECDAVAVILHASLQDISASYEDGCDAGWFDLSGSVLEEPGCPLLAVGLVPSAVHLASGLGLALDGFYQYDEVAAFGPDAEYAYVGVVDMPSGDPGILAGLDLAARPLAEGSRWMPFWAFFRTQGDETLRGVPLWFVGFIPSY